jgi:hypothetical protein
LGATAGAVALFGAGIIGYRRHQRRAWQNKDKSWTEAEMARFRQAYQKNHDFEALCQTFPDKSRESIARRAKSMMNTNNPFFGRDSYKFLRSRARATWNKYHPSPNNTLPKLPKASSVSRTTTAEISSQGGSLVRIPVSSTRSLTPFASSSQYAAAFQLSEPTKNLPVGMSPPPGLSIVTSNPLFEPPGPSTISTVSY